MSYGENRHGTLASATTIAHDFACFDRWTGSMAPPRQGDLFQDGDEQPELFENAPTPVYRADPEEVRRELHRILAEARAAQRLPWEPRRVSLYRTIFPQMTNWLPEDEGTQLRFAFETELARLEAA